MAEYEWIVCLGCGKTGWLDLNEPMNRTGWNSKHQLYGPHDKLLNFHLCSKCDCMNCGDAIITTGWNEDGSTYPDIECQLVDEGCRYIQKLRSSCQKVNKSD